MPPKDETTIALTPVAYRSAWIGREAVLSGQWLARWDRSGAKFPPEMALADRAVLESVVRQHEQFRPVRVPR